MRLLLMLFLFCSVHTFGQVMTPEILWQLGRVSPVGLSDDRSAVLYKVSYPDMENNNFNSENYVYKLSSGETAKGVDYSAYRKDPARSNEGKYRLVVRDVKLKSITGVDRYPALGKSDVKIYDALHHRHWDSWEDGSYSHLFIETTDGSAETIDILKDEPYDVPTKPFGGSEDYTWNPDGTEVVYVCKKLFGTDYVNSTNTDLYAYDLSTGITKNLTEDNPGYDTHPVFSSTGQLAWLSMARDGYESDKNDIKTIIDGETVNLTKDWDGSVSEFIFGQDGKSVLFAAATGGTTQLFVLDIPRKADKSNRPKMITDGQWDISGLVGEVDKKVIVGRMDMNHAKEIFSIDVDSGEMVQLSHVNDEIYANIKMSKVDLRKVTTSDGKTMVTWVIYPPDFDPEKKYPTLLYTQGGPQSALSQFYSFRWNFQVMAAKGYIIVAPNRRGMPGHGVAWNEQISKDWGGLNMQDYLSAIDHVSMERFVDKDRIGCVGASYGGYSVFYLAGIHEGRFKSFISHDGIFNLKSMYGNTEELFFANWDMGGPYWDKSNAAAQKTYREFDPINKVDKWNTPILIFQGGKDYRVPEGQAFEAFTAAQQRGIKSRLVYFPEENHWVLKPQNGLVWQYEFFRWLEETL